MKTESKNRLMMWTIVLLALMNISTLVTIVYTRNQMKSESNSKAALQMETERSAMRFSGRYFRDELGFTRQQMQQFAAFNPGFRKQVQLINRQLSIHRQQMLENMSATDVDTIRLNQLCDSIGYLHAELKKITYGYYLNIKDICDKSQQLELEQLFNNVFAGELQPGPHGRNNQTDRRRGRQIQN
ncbi:MAG: hypothetical protein JXQ80_07615 [Bacteroidales bacterium]|nr:hypothetical protein [Bacteroidales bacterium]